MKRIECLENHLGDGSNGGMTGGDNEMQSVTQLIKPILPLHMSGFDKFLNWLDSHIHAVVIRGPRLHSEHSTAPTKWQGGRELL